MERKIYLYKKPAAGAGRIEILYRSPPLKMSKIFGRGDLQGNLVINASLFQLFKVCKILNLCFFFLFQVSKNLFNTDFGRILTKKAPAKAHNSDPQIPAICAELSQVLLSSIFWCKVPTQSWTPLASAFSAFEENFKQQPLHFQLECQT